MFTCACSHHSVRNVLVGLGDAVGGCCEYVCRTIDQNCRVIDAYFCRHAATTDALFPQVTVETGRLAL
jgi:hypothetical protein